MTHVFSQLQALWVRQLLDNIYHHAFMAYWLGYSLRKYKPEWATLSMPHSTAEPPWFYKLQYQACRYIEQVDPILLKPGTSVKMLYKCFKERINEQPTIELQGSNIDFKPIWRQIWNLYMTDKYRDTNWKLISKAVYMRGEPYCFRPAKCVLCQDFFETLSHLLCTCIMVRPLWEYISYLVSKMSNAQCSVTNSAILYHHINIPTRLVKAVHFFLGTARVIIWKVRCEVFYENNKKPSSIGLIQQFKGRLRKTILHDFERLSSEHFHQYWIHNFTPCEVNGQLIFNW